MMPTYQFPIKYPSKDPLPGKWFIILVMIVIIIAALITYWANNAHAQEIDLNIIAQIESNNNPLAYNQKTGASGMFQLMPCVVEEYNARHIGSKIAFKAVFSPIVARTIAEWYLAIRIPQMLKYYNKPITLENILICYNAGIGNLVKGIVPLETRNYIKKYNRLCQLTKN